MTYRAAAALFGALIIFASAASASAQKETRVEGFRDWNVFKADGASGPICWAVTVPVKSEASKKNVKRGEIYMMVAVRPADKVRNEISVVFGYPHKKGAAATAAVGDTSFSMFTEGEGAWLSSPAEDDRMVAALRKGSTAIVKGESTRGTRTTDTFSLLGFTAALKKTRALCQ